MYALDICLVNGALSISVPYLGLSALVDQIVFDTPIQPREGRTFRAQVLSLHGLSQATAHMLPGDLVRSIGIAPQYRGRLPRPAGTLVKRWRATPEGFKLAWL